MEDSNKAKRVLNILKRLENGEIINKIQEASKYEVSEKTIERDINDIREYMVSRDNNGSVGNFVKYDRAAKGYRLKKRESKVSVIVKYWQYVRYYWTAERLLKHRWIA